MANLHPDILSRSGLESLATELARYLRPGDVVVLSGEVGAGKTTFARAACAALGVKERVTSPTYQLARSYRGFVGELQITVNHLDLYRLEGVGVEDALELDEYLTAGSITFIEWAEPAEGVIRDPSRIFFEHVSEDTRGVSVEGPLAARRGTDEC